MKSNKKIIAIVAICAVVVIGAVLAIALNDNSLPVDAKGDEVQNDTENEEVGEVTTSESSENEEAVTTLPEGSDSDITLAPTDDTTGSSKEEVTTTTEATTEDTVASTEAPVSSAESDTSMTEKEEDAEVEIEDDSEYEVDIDDEDTEVIPEDPQIVITQPVIPYQGFETLPEVTLPQLQSTKYRSVEESDIEGDPVTVTETYEYVYSGDQVYSIERRMTVDTRDSLTYSLYKSVFKGIIKDNEGLQSFSGEFIEEDGKCTLIMRFENLNDPVTAKILLDEGLITGNKEANAVYLSESVSKLTEKGFVKEN